MNHSGSNSSPDGFNSAPNIVYWELDFAIDPNTDLLDPDCALARYITIVTQAKAAELEQDRTRFDELVAELRSLPGYPTGIDPIRDEVRIVPRRTRSLRISLARTMPIALKPPLLSD